ncbi:MAG: DUF4446 family protein [Patescibacteria group bacterium]|nr:DUF4446 family protein [Patescibacteria group bacterium]
MSFHSLPLYLSDAAPYAAAGALLLALIGIIVAWRAHRRLRKLTFRRGESLEDTLGELTRRTRELGTFKEELESYLKYAEARLQKSVRGVGVVRFNPFQGEGTGGNQSFAAAFLDEKGSGVVLCAIYSRAGQTSVYAKPVEQGRSQFELTQEERDAIDKAVGSLKTATPAPAQK